MTDEEIKSLAKETKTRNFCEKFHRPLDCSECPLNYDTYECGNDYDIGFVDGYKAAFDKLIEKINEKIKDMKK